MNANFLRVGIVGCGRIAQAHLEAMQYVPELQLQALCDVNESNLSQTLATLPAGLHENNCKSTELLVFTSYEAMLSEAQLDAVILCTPPVTHASFAKSFMQAGLHVLCEKPLAPTLREAQQMIEVARLQNVQLVLALKFRFVSDAVEAGNIIQRGEIGEVVSFECCFCQPVSMKSRWNSQREISGGGVLMDNGPHAVDLVRCVLGPVEAVQANLCSRTQQLNVEDSALLMLRLHSGVLGTIKLSWSTHDPSSYLKISGTEGSIYLNWNESLLCRQTSNGKEETRFGEGYQKQQVFIRQLQHFASAIHKNKSEMIFPEDALASVAVVEAAYKSAQEQCTCKIEDRVERM